MTLRDRIPVEPLSDERVTNIERRVVVGASDALGRPALRDLARPRWMGFAAAAAVALVVGVVGWRIGASSTAPTGSTTTTTTTTEIAAAEPIRVDTRERTTLDIGDARITHEPNTLVVITRPAGGVLVEMTRGKVELEVGKRGDRPPLVVRAGDTDVTVVGTRFSVDYGDGTQPPTVIVTEGIVSVTHARKPAQRVAANHAWTHARGVVAVTELAAATALGAPPTTTSASATTVAMNDEHALRDRQGATPSGSIRAPAERTTPAPTDGGSGERTTGRKLQVTQYTRDLHEALRNQPIAPAYDNGIADPKASIAALYKDVAGMNEPAVITPAQALYSIAVLQLIKLRSPADALKTLDHYFRRFTQKADHADALWLKVRILCEVRFDERCKQAATVYRDVVQTGAKAGMANEITAAHE